MKKNSVKKIVIYLMVGFVMLPIGSCYTYPVYYSSPSSEGGSGGGGSSSTVFNLQTGRYAASGTNTTMQLGFGTVTLYDGQTIAAQGTYRTNGNQLSITFTAAYGDYTHFRGMTYAFNITSDTSFSNQREIWVRRGSF